MRVTMHNGRIGKDGAFSARHNDRDFDTSKAEHIDQEKTVHNFNWYYCQKERPGMSFEEAEQVFYENTFSRALEARNRRYKAQRHPERVKSMDDYRKGPQSCPEEAILEVGNIKASIPAYTLYSICQEQLLWEMQTFPQVKILDASLHVDEPDSAPHMHVRKVWVADSKDGPVVGQNKALKQMGIERPDMDKEEGRYNNAKITYTMQCREHFVGLCQKYGLDVETKPKEASEVGLSLLQKKFNSAKEQIEQAKQELSATKHKRDEAATEAKTAFDLTFNSRIRELRKQKEEQQAKEEELKNREQAVKDAEDGLIDGYELGRSLSRSRASKDLSL